MIGQTIETRGSFPWGTVIFACLFCILFAAALVLRNLDVLLMSVFPAACALLLFLTLPRRRAYYVTPTGLESLTGELISYASIHAVYPTDRAANDASVSDDRFPLAIDHREGTLLLPANLNVPSSDLFNFLRGVVDTRPPQVHPHLAAYLEQNLAAFGPEQVSAFSFNHVPRRHAAVRVTMVLALASVLAGALWAAAGGKELQGFGIGLLVLSFYLFLALGILRLVGNPQKKKLKDSSLVVGPMGLAMIQGPLTGELRWDEVRNARLKKNHIMVKVEGAQFMIANIYNRPLTAIFAEMQRYWG